MREWRTVLVWFVSSCGFFAQACEKEKTEPAPATTASAREPVSQAPAREPAPVGSARVAAAAEVERTCTSICDRSRTLKCAHVAECQPNCVAMAVGTPCSGAFMSFYACLVREPVEHWECSEDGIAAIKDGFCQKEQEAAVGCLEAKAER